MKVLYISYISYTFVNTVVHMLKKKKPSLYERQTIGMHDQTILLSSNCSLFILQWSLFVSVLTESSQSVKDTFVDMAIHLHLFD